MKKTISRYEQLQREKRSAWIHFGIFLLIELLIIIGLPFLGGFSAAGYMSRFEPGDRLRILGIIQQFPVFLNTPDGQAVLRIMSAMCVPALISILYAVMLTALYLQYPLRRKEYKRLKAKFEGNKVYNKLEPLPIRLRIRRIPASLIKKRMVS